MISLRELTYGVATKGSSVASDIAIYVIKRHGLITAYQPDPFDSNCTRDRPGVRPSVDRFDAFNAALPRGEALSSLDIGCNQGYFTFKMAERGGYCIGLDWGHNEIFMARGLARKNKVENVAFSQLEVSAESIMSFPKVDLVICLSIYHHWARKMGENEARRIMIALASRTSRYMVFETGHPREEAKWARKLVFMNPNPDGYVRALLTDIGFNEVLDLGEFQTNLSSVPRHLYIAAKDGHGFRNE